MGTIQGKIKDSFSLKQKPLLKKTYQSGQPPLLNGHTQTSMWPSTSKHESKEINKYASRMDYSRKGRDDLELSMDSQIQNLKQYPYCSVGVVMYEVGGHKKYGTGFLIGKNIVLTCAHNLFSLDYGQTASNVSYNPSYHKYKEKEFYKAKQIFYPKEFQKLSLKGNELFQESLCKNDYGIIKLQENVNLEANYGYLGFNFTSQQHSLASNKTIMGFTHIQNKLITLHSFSGKVHITDQVISYPFPTQIGMSGGPILEEVNGNFIAIGIHTYFKGRGKKGNGQGIRLNQQKFDQINSWLQVYQEVIDLRDKNLGKDGVKQLVRQQKYSFDVINLSKNCLQKQGLKHFSRVQWPNLYNLDLGGNNLGNQGIQYLIKTSISNLSILNLWGNKINEKGIQILIKGQWPKLQNLNLYNNEIGIKGLQILSVQDWPCLSSLNLGKNYLQVQAIEVLKYCKWKSNLICLNLWGNSLKKDKKTVQSLHMLFPKLKYLYLQ